MELMIGMTKTGLRVFALDIIKACDKADAEGSTFIEPVERTIPANGNGPELTLRIDNDDMVGDHVTAADSYYELEN